MHSPVRVLKVTPAKPRDRRRGLFAFARVAISGDFVLDGLAVRRTADGRMCIAFPERTDRRGRRHPIIRPISTDVRNALEQAVLRYLTEMEGWS